MAGGLIGKAAKLVKGKKKKPPKRDHYKEEREGKKKFEESQRKEAAERREKKKTFIDDMINKEEARIKNKTPPQNAIEAAQDKEYAARKAYAKKHGSTANRINAKKKQLKNKEAKAKHNRN